MEAAALLRFKRAVFGPFSTPRWLIAPENHTEFGIGAISVNGGHRAKRKWDFLVRLWLGRGLLWEGHWVHLGNGFLLTRRAFFCF